MKRLTTLALVTMLIALGLLLSGARMVSAAPAAPTLVSPANGTTVTGTSVTFEWTTAPEAVDYRLAVSRSTNPLDTTTRKISILVGNMTTYTDTGYPANGTKYYWWVWAYNADGAQSAWSEVSANGRWFRTPTHATVTVTAPSAISFGTFHMGWNLQTSGTAGTVTVTPGTFGDTSWTVTATCKLYMGVGTTTYLSTPLLIGKDVATWHVGDGSNVTISRGGQEFTVGGFLTYSGTTVTDSLPFYAYQFIDDVDITTKGGVYTSTITFSATYDP
jgi:hypothetical protein